MYLQSGQGWGGSGQSLWLQHEPTSRRHPVLAVLEWLPQEAWAAERPRKLHVFTERTRLGREWRGAVTWRAVLVRGARSVLLELLVVPVIAVMLLVREAQSRRAQAAAKQAEDQARAQRAACPFRCVSPTAGRRSVMDPGGDARVVRGQAQLGAARDADARAGQHGRGHPPQFTVSAGTGIDELITALAGCHRLEQLADADCPKKWYEKRTMWPIAQFRSGAAS
jgi:hypothetical protein